MISNLQYFKIEEFYRDIWTHLKRFENPDRSAQSFSSGFQPITIFNCF